MTYRPRRPAEEVATLTAALAWLRTAWTTLPVPPAKLHDRDIEELSALGSHRFSAAFARLLDGKPTDTEISEETVTCYHPRLVDRDDVRACPDCSGDGVTKATRVRYRSPMSAALSRLSKMPRPSDGTPAPIDYIIALAAGGWDMRQAAKLLGYHVLSPDHSQTIDAMFLLAIRRLHERYSAGPVGRSVPYTELSEAQRNALDAA